MTDTTTPEPEEIVEARLVTALQAALPGFVVVGVLSPFPAGTVKETPDTYVSVVVDIADQNIDWKGPGPFTYSAGVTVHVADPDDPTGKTFRDMCRAVRAVLGGFLGDGCAALDGDGFSCDSFMLGATQTRRESVDNYTETAKTYPATLVGRYTPQTQEA
ncbi:MAG: hypothetical protein IJI54_05950 [Kiritimatiellae bacterium]|nr:hypothetical protein [Kiritimatiellia bacterium]